MTLTLIDGVKWLALYKIIFNLLTLPLQGTSTTLVLVAAGLLCQSLSALGMAGPQTTIKDQYGNTIKTYYTSSRSSYPQYYARSYAPTDYYNDPVVYYRSSDSYLCDNCADTVVSRASYDTYTGTVFLFVFALHPFLTRFLYRSFICLPKVCKTFPKCPWLII